MRILKQRDEYDPEIRFLLLNSRLKELNHTDGPQNTVKAEEPQYFARPIDRWI